MEKWIEHHAGLPEDVRIALEILAVSGGPQESFDNYVDLIYNHGGIERSLAGS